MIFKDKKLSIHWNETGKNSVLNSKLKKYLLACTNSISFFLHNKKHGLGWKDSQFIEISCSITLVGKSKIKSLNRDYRNKDKITDVLSFGVHEELRYEKMPDAFLELGDIFICKEVALSQSKEFKISFEEEIIHLLFHGILHLLGFDHELSDEEELLMEGKEKFLLEQMRKEL